MIKTVAALVVIQDLSEAKEWRTVNEIKTTTLILILAAKRTTLRGNKKNDKKFEEVSGA
jgi:hypothetical protein